MRPNGEAMVRQGDVLLIPTDDVPDGRQLVAPENGRLILALGEATGHHHALVLTDPNDAELCDVAGEVDRWLRVRSVSLPLVHEEHGTIIVQQRNYIVRRQREYHPEEIRRVRD